MYWFRNAVIYRVTSDINWQNFNEKLQECAFKPCQPSDLSKFGWVSPLAGKEVLAHEANGKILLVATLEEKILPSDVINRELNQRVKAFEEREKRKVRKVERLAIKDDVVATLLPKAFSKQKHTALFIDTAKKLIYIDTPSFKKAEDVLALLRKSLGSLPVVPLRFNSPVFDVMTNWVINSNTPDWLILRDEIEIQGDDLSVVHCKQKAVEGVEIVELVKDGYVSKLAFEWENRLNFVINGSAILKRLKFTDNIKEWNNHILKEDVSTRFDADFVLMTDELTRLIELLSGEFGGINEEQTTR